MADAPHPGKPAVFFDRDNTLIVGSDYLGDPEGVELMPGAARVVAGARKLGYAVAVVSNQSGVARGLYTEDDVRRVNDRLDQKLREGNPNATVDLHAFCPHHPEGRGDYAVDCDCRKPKAGMITSAAAELGVDLKSSWLVGDVPRDVEAGRSAGCRTILLTVPNIKQSPAASAESSVQPDFRASSLAEVLVILQRESGAIAAPPATATKPLALPKKPEGPRRYTAEDVASVTTDPLLADQRRARETPTDEFNVFRLLAGAVQVLALAAFVWGVAFGNDSVPNVTGLIAAVYLQLLTITLLFASK